MKVLKDIRHWMNEIIMWGAVIMFMLMVVVGTYQIVARYFFGSPSTISEELLTYSFTWMSMFASAYVFGKRDHMRMAFLADMLKGKARIVLEVIIECTIFIFSALALVWGGITIMNLTMHQATASLGIPMGYVYSILPVSGICICIYAILNIIDMLHGKDLAMHNGVEEGELS